MLAASTTSTPDANVLFLLRFIPELHTSWIDSLKMFWIASNNRKHCQYKQYWCFLKLLDFQFHSGFSIQWVPYKSNKYHLPDRPNKSWDQYSYRLYSYIQGLGEDTDLNPSPILTNSNSSIRTLGWPSITNWCKHDVIKCLWSLIFENEVA